MTHTLELNRQQTAPVREAPAPPKRARDPFFDNAKMLLVTLVVVGHSWVLLPDSWVSHWFYDFLYVWHVPAFVMVTGYLSRSFTWTRRNLSRLVTTVAVPYVIFEAAIAAFRIEVGGEQLEGLFADPHWPMWYLAVLFIWRLATPLLKSPKALVAAVAISLLGGLIAGDYLDSARASGLLPFFVLGLLARPEHVELLRRPAVRAAAGLVLLATFALAPLIHGRLSIEWLYWRTGYAEIGVPAAQGMLVRGGLLVVAALVATSFLAFVPRSSSWFTRLGAATLVVYLFHGFFVKSAEYAGVGARFEGHPWAGLAVLTALSVVLALTLAAPPVARRLNLVVDPVGSFRRR